MKQVYFLMMLAMASLPAMAMEHGVITTGEISAGLNSINIETQRDIGAFLRECRYEYTKNDNNFDLIKEYLKIMPIDAYNGLYEALKNVIPEERKLLLYERVLPQAKKKKKYRPIDPKEIKLARLIRRTVDNFMETNFTLENVLYEKKCQEVSREYARKCEEAYQEKELCEALQKKYNEVKQEIDENYKYYIENPVRFDIGTMKLKDWSSKESSQSSPSPKYTLHTRRRRNSRDRAITMYEKAKTAETIDSDSPEETILTKVYKDTFKKSEHFEKKFQEKKQQFFDSYAIAGQSFEQYKYIEAVRSIETALECGKKALWYLTQQKKEKKNISKISQYVNDDKYASSGGENKDEESDDDLGTGIDKNPDLGDEA